MEVKQQGVLNVTAKCVFCNGTDIDEIKYGPMYTYQSITTHYHCMLLSPNLIQNAGDPDEALLGFLVQDIIKEVRRGSKLTCTYCKKKGASLGCIIRKCNVKFHLPCGLKNGTLHQFFGDYKSFCAKHRPVQDISPRILREACSEVICAICHEKVDPCASDTLWAPCCQKNAFFHRFCIQNLALNAGYLFRCPLCNNEVTFTEEMKKFGIFVPDQDAAWERVPSAYEELLMRHDTCDSVTCNCPSGCKTNRRGTKWELILCKFCGSQGMHVECGNLNIKSPEFSCSICSGSDLVTRQEQRAEITFLRPEEEALKALKSRGSQ